MRLRPAVRSDSSDIRAVHLRAFPTKAEADLVERLVGDGEALISIVALEDREIVGHVLFSRMDVEADGGALNALGLAPFAVVPQSKGRGIGSALIEAGIAEARRMGADMIFVVGDTEFYGRFGFEGETALPFVSPYPGHHFQALPLNQDVGSVRRVTASYARAFDEL